MKRLFFTLLLAAVLAETAASAVTRYVKQDGTTAAANAAAATSWAAACSDLQAVIEASSPGDEVWVAAGTYKPNRSAKAPGAIGSSTDRWNTFVMRPGVKVYGGFNSTNPENAVSARKTYRNAQGVQQMTHKTILSGDINNLSKLDNKDAYHVVLAVGNLVSGGDTARLDGFVVTGGFADGGGGSDNTITLNGASAEIHHGSGGGIYAKGSGLQLAYDSVAGCWASLRGGGLYAEGETGGCVHVVVCGNTTNNSGGGVYVKGGALSATNLLVSGNTTNNYGGGMFVEGGALSATNLHVSGNTSTNSNSNINEGNTGGGGVYITGGGALSATNLLVSGNIAS
ncbi:MAG: hypothetical protein LBF67_05745, partial [Prevotellaceae bacterium]|nr:hypothetical protein [Prevotellaceae bacterium]